MPSVALIRVSTTSCVPIAALYRLASVTLHVNVGRLLFFIYTHICITVTSSFENIFRCVFYIRLSGNSLRRGDGGGCASREIPLSPLSPRRPVCGRVVSGRGNRIANVGNRGRLGNRIIRPSDVSTVSCRKITAPEVSRVKT